MLNNLQYASSGMRFAAGFIDVVLGSIIGFIFLKTGVPKPFGQIIMLIIFALFTSSRYQGTPGKLLIGLKVTKLNGEQVSFWRALLRYGIYSLICFFIAIAAIEIRVYVLSPLWFPVTIGLIALIPVAGYSMILFTSRKQGFHDKIAGTLVVLRKASLNTGFELDPEKI